MPQRAPRGGVAVRFREMARSLLLSRIVRIVLFAAASSMSACIIPVAPQFQDPPSDPQVPPSFVRGSAKPAFGTLTLVPSSGFQFSVSVSDPTPGVTLYYRVALDYPVFKSSTRTVKNQELVVNGQVSFSLDCNANPDPSVGLQHQLFVIVADQMFATGDQDLEALVNPGQSTENFWQVDMSCMASSTP